MMRTTTNMIGLTMNRLRVASESTSGSGHQYEVVPDDITLRHSHIVRRIVETMATAVTIVG